MMPRLIWSRPAGIRQSRTNAVQWGTFAKQPAKD